ncbi:MAG: PAS domain S-box protein [Bacteroidota bacterium]|nr:PAS domain S-box protein [Bacteroidota bacterium]
MENLKIEGSREHVALLFENNPVPMFIYDDLEYHILAINNAAIYKYGYTRDEFLKMKINDIRVEETESNQPESIIDYSIKTEGKEILRHKTKDGTIIDVENVSNKIILGDKFAWLVASYDITYRKRLERQLQLQYDVAMILAETASLKAAGTKILKMICLSENWKVGELWFEDSGGSFLKLESSWYSSSVDGSELEEVSRNYKLVKGQGILGRVWQDGKPRMVKDFKSYMLARTIYLIKSGLKTAYVFPLISGSQTKGVLAFFSDNSLEPDKSIMLMLEVLGKQLGVFCLKYLASETSSQNELRLKGVVDSAMDAIITANADQKIILFNTAAEKMFACKADDVMGKPINIFIPDRYKGIHSQHIVNFGKTGITNRKIGSLGTLSAVRMNGEEFPIEASISQINIGNEILYTVILRDVTDSKIAGEQIAQNLKEKEVLLKEIHHRVKNNLQIISSLLSLQGNYMNDPKVIELFDESRHRVKAMALIHEKLYASNLLSKVNLKEYVSDLLQYLVTSYEYSTGNITLKLDIEDISISLDFIVPFGLILNELVSNSLKYAFPNRQKGTISVSFKESDSTKFLLTFEDNGIGMKEIPDVSKINTLGMQLIFNLADQLKGLLRFEISNGTKVFILIPNNF